MNDSIPVPSRQRPSKTLVRFPRAKTLFVFAIGILATKIFVMILAEYRFYFPANYQATFLLGREDSFHGLYAIAFYIHLIVAPITLLLAVFLISTGLNCTDRLEACLTFKGLSLMPVKRRWHRRAGRLQAGLVIVFLVPSGLVMATQALAGPIAGVGFVCLSLATGLSVAAAAVTAIRGRIQSHRRWAIRSAILLASPLLLRFLAGAAFLLQIDSPEFYRLNAWVSWLLPLISYEAFRFYRRRAFASPTNFPKSFLKTRCRDESLQME